MATIAEIANRMEGYLPFIDYLGAKTKKAGQKELWTRLGCMKAAILYPDEVQISLADMRVYEYYIQRVEKRTRKDGHSSLAPRYDPPVVDIDEEDSLKSPEVTHYLQSVMEREDNGGDSEIFLLDSPSPKQSLSILSPDVSLESFSEPKTIPLERARDADFNEFRIDYETSFINPEKSKDILQMSLDSGISPFRDPSLNELASKNRSRAENAVKEHAETSLLGLRSSAESILAQNVLRDATVTDNSTGDLTIEGLREILNTVYKEKTADNKQLPSEDDRKLTKDEGKLPTSEVALKESVNVTSNVEEHTSPVSGEIKPVSIQSAITSSIIRRKSVDGRNTLSIVGSKSSVSNTEQNVPSLTIDDDLAIQQQAVLAKPPPPTDRIDDSLLSRRRNVISSYRMKKIPDEAMVSNRDPRLKPRTPEVTPPKISKAAEMKNRLKEHLTDITPVTPSGTGALKMTRENLQKKKESTQTKAPKSVDSFETALLSSDSAGKPKKISLAQYTSKKSQEGDAPPPLSDTDTTKKRKSSETVNEKKEVISRTSSVDKSKKEDKKCIKKDDKVTSKKEETKGKHDQLTCTKKSKESPVKQKEPTSPEKKAKEKEKDKKNKSGDAQEVKKDEQKVKGSDSSKKVEKHKDKNKSKSKDEQVKHSESLQKSKKNEDVSKKKSEKSKQNDKVTESKEKPKKDQEKSKMAKNEVELKRKVEIMNTSNDKKASKKSEKSSPKQKKENHVDKKDKKKGEHVNKKKNEEPVDKKEKKREDHVADNKKGKKKEDNGLENKKKKEDHVNNKKNKKKEEGVVDNKKDRKKEDHSTAKKKNVSSFGKEIEKLSNSEKETHLSTFEVEKGDKGMLKEGVIESLLDESKKEPRADIDLSEESKKETQESKNSCIGSDATMIDKELNKIERKEEATTSVKDGKSKDALIASDATLIESKEKEAATVAQSEDDSKVLSAVTVGKVLNNEGEEKLIQETIQSKNTPNVSESVEHNQLEKNTVDKGFEESQLELSNLETAGKGIGKQSEDEHDSTAVRSEIILKPSIESESDKTQKENERLLPNDSRSEVKGIGEESVQSDTSKGTDLMAATIEKQTVPDAMDKGADLGAENATKLGIVEERAIENVHKGRVTPDENGKAIAGNQEYDGLKQGNESMEATTAVEEGAVKESAPNSNDTMKKNEEVATNHKVKSVEDLNLNFNSSKLEIMGLIVRDIKEGGERTILLNNERNRKVDGELLPKTEDIMVENSNDDHASPEPTVKSENDIDVNDGKQQDTVVSVQDANVSSTISDAVNKCQYCTSFYKGNLVYHHMTYHRGLDVPCYLVKKHLQDIQDDLLRFLKSLPSEEVFAKYVHCFACEFSTMSRNALVDHLYKHSMFICRFCGLQRGNELEFYDHIAFHTGEYRYECDLCSYTAYGASMVKRHKTAKHKVKNSSIRLVAPNFYMSHWLYAYVCDCCYFTQINESTVRKHVETAHQGAGNVIFLNMSCRSLDQSHSVVINRICETENEGSAQDAEDVTNTFMEANKSTEDVEKNADEATTSTLDVDNTFVEAKVKDAAYAPRLQVEDRQNTCSSEVDSTSLETEIENEIKDSTAEAVSAIENSSEQNKNVKNQEAATTSRLGENMFAEPIINAEDLEKEATTSILETVENTSEPNIEGLGKDVSADEATASSFEVENTFAESIKNAEGLEKEATTSILEKVENTSEPNIEGLGKDVSADEVTASSFEVENTFAESIKNAEGLEKEATTSILEKVENTSEPNIEGLGKDVSADEATASSFEVENTFAESIKNAEGLEKEATTSILEKVENTSEPNIEGLGKDVSADEATASSFEVENTFVEATTNRNQVDDAIASSYNLEVENTPTQAKRNGNDGSTVESTTEVDKVEDTAATTSSLKSNNSSAETEKIKDQVEDTTATTSRLEANNSSAETEIIKDQVSLEDTEVETDTFILKEGEESIEDPAGYSDVDDAMELELEEGEEDSIGEHIGEKKIINEPDGGQEDPLSSNKEEIRFKIEKEDGHHVDTNVPALDVRGASFVKEECRSASTTPELPIESPENQVFPKNIADVITKKKKSKVSTKVLKKMMKENEIFDSPVSETPVEETTDEDKAQKMEQLFVNLKEKFDVSSTQSVFADIGGKIASRKSKGLIETSTVEVPDLQQEPTSRIQQESTSSTQQKVSQPQSVNPSDENENDIDSGTDSEEVDVGDEAELIESDDDISETCEIPEVNEEELSSRLPNSFFGVLRQLQNNVTAPFKPRELTAEEKEMLFKEEREEEDEEESEDSPERTDNEEKVLMMCDFSDCPASFTEDEVVQHLKEIHGPYICCWNSCNLSYRCKEEFIKHVLVDHHSVPLRYTCKYCDGKYEELTDLADHMEISHVKTSNPSINVETSNPSINVKTSNPSIRVRSDLYIVSPENPPLLITEPCSIEKNDFNSKPNLPETECGNPLGQELQQRKPPFQPEEKQRVKGMKSKIAYRELCRPENIVKLFKCMDIHCVFACDSADEFSNHLKSHKVDNYICCYCAYANPTRYEATAHIVRKHSYCSYQCAYCFYRAISPQYMIKHQEVDHAVESKKYFTCNVKTKAKPEFKEDYAKVFLNYRCQIDGCKFAAPIAKAFLIHIREKHPLSVTYKCSYCIREMSSPERLINHHRIHNINEHQCLYCLYGTSSSNDMLVHQCRAHLNLPPKILHRGDHSTIDSDAPSTDHDYLEQRHVFDPDEEDDSSDESPTPTSVPSGLFGGSLASTSGVVAPTASVLPVSAASASILRNSLTNATPRSSFRPILPKLTLSSQLLPPVLPLSWHKPGSDTAKTLPLSSVSPPAPPSLELPAQIFSENSLEINDLEESNSSTSCAASLNPTESEESCGNSSQDTPHTATGSTEQDSSNASTGAVPQETMSSTSDKAPSDIISSRRDSNTSQERVASPDNLPEPPRTPMKRRLEDTASKDTLLQSPTEEGKRTRRSSRVSSSPRSCQSSPEKPAKIARRNSKVSEDWDKENLSKDGIMEGLNGFSLYKCLYQGCDFAISEAAYLREHLMICDFARNHKDTMSCPHCYKNVKSINLYLEHLKLHMSRKYHCSRCPYKGQTLSYTSRHLRQVHKVTNFRYVEDGSDTKNYILFSKDTPEAVITKFVTMFREGGQLFPTKGKYDFRPEEESLLPIEPVLSKDLKCVLCEFKTKVTKNMRRHLKQHDLHNANMKFCKIVPSTNPVNPIPEKTELEFDKMKNLAGSSHDEKMQISPEDMARLPKEVEEGMRYVCGMDDCSYMNHSCVFLKHHLVALHSDTNVYPCAHCKENAGLMTSDKLFGHFKLHGPKLYKCPHCYYHHFAKKATEKHVKNKHPTLRQGVLTVREPHMDKKVEVPEPVELPPKTMQRWRCSMCVHLASSCNEAECHFKKRHRITGHYRCSICNQGSKSKQMLESHFRSKHHGEECTILQNFSKVTVPISATPVFNLHPKPLWSKSLQRTYRRHIRGIFLDEAETTVYSSAATPPKQDEPIKQEPLPEAKPSPVVESPVTNKYSCPQCQRYKSTNAIAFKDHLHKCLDYKKYVCTYCKMMACTVDAVKSHTTKVHPFKPQAFALVSNPEYEKVIDEILLTQQNLIEAAGGIEETTSKTSEPKEKTKKQKVPYCQACSAIFSDYKLLQSHIVSEHPQNRLLCGVCGVMCSTESNLGRHMKLSVQRHAGMGQVQPQEASHTKSVKMYRCAECGFRTRHLDVHTSHTQSCTKPSTDSLKCKYCPHVTCRSLIGIKRHNRIMHPKLQSTNLYVKEEVRDANVAVEDLVEEGISQSGIKARTIKCAYCSFTGMTINKVRNHWSETHASSTPFLQFKTKRIPKNVSHKSCDSPVDPEQSSDLEKKEPVEEDKYMCGHCDDGPFDLTTLGKHHWCFHSHLNLAEVLIPRKKRPVDDQLESPPTKVRCVARKSTSLPHSSVEGYSYYGRPRSPLPDLSKIKLRPPGFPAGTCFRISEYCRLYNIEPALRLRRIDDT